MVPYKRVLEALILITVTGCFFHPKKSVPTTSVIGVTAPQPTSIQATITTTSVGKKDEIVAEMTGNSVVVFETASYRIASIEQKITHYPSDGTQLLGTWSVENKQADYKVEIGFFDLGIQATDTGGGPMLFTDFSLHEAFTQKPIKVTFMPCMTVFENRIDRCLFGVRFYNQTLQPHEVRYYTLMAKVQGDDNADDTYTVYLLNGLVSITPVERPKSQPAFTAGN